ncbi:ribonuclease P protein component [bacterium]|jgi:ribonuclease P protein component|nr:ribonuclease P protein component [bacterium]MDA7908261.1 ribonuclease P protein component [Akkermansiaceae bacterium]MDB4422470.1 ribonuclease P protein component [bacterium]MDB4572492.1 ribonuclease P protein component [Akkermansiaceae bacterium]MDF1714501.1 ribonuclease P protein component [Akkermansiaceae bacterium]
MKLTRQRRMRQWGEFQVVRTKGQSAAGKYLVLGMLENGSAPDRRFGLITSKKAGKAVTRNLLRRRFREIIRKHGDHLPPKVMLVAIARWRASQATFQQLEADWIKTAKRLKLWQEQPIDPS